MSAFSKEIHTIRRVKAITSSCITDQMSSIDRHCFTIWQHPDDVPIHFAVSKTRPSVRFALFDPILPPSISRSREHGLALPTGIVKGDRAVFERFNVRQKARRGPVPCVLCIPSGAKKNRRQQPHDVAVIGRDKGRPNNGRAS